MYFQLFGDFVVDRKQEVVVAWALAKCLQPEMHDGSGLRNCKKLCLAMPDRPNRDLVSISTE